MINKSISQDIKNKESLLFFFGWTAVALFSTIGNTSLGLLILILNELYLLWHKKHLSFHINQKIHILVILFLGWSSFTVIFAYDKTLAFLVTLGYSLMVYIAFWGAEKLFQQRMFFNNYFIPLMKISSIFSSCYVIFTYFFYNIKRGQTLLVGTNGTGTLLIISSFMLLSCFDYYRKKENMVNSSYHWVRYSKFLFIPFLLSVIAMILTYSRGALVGFLTGFTFYNLRSQKNIILFLITIILLLSIFLISPQFRNRFMSIFSLEANNNRIQIWTSTIEIIKDHSFLGIGPGNFSVVYPDYKTPEAKESNHPFSHNIFSNMAAELGIPGLILFIMIIIYLLKMGYIISKINTLYRGLFSSFIGILVHLQFDCIILGIEIGTLFWLIAGLITVIYSKETLKSPDI